MLRRAVPLCLGLTSVVAFTSPVLSRAWSPFASFGRNGLSMSTTGARTEERRLPVICDDDVMSDKAHGTCTGPPQDNLRWGCSGETADKICCFNRHFAEYSGYWLTTVFIEEASREEPTIFYDSVSGKKLFQAPVGRSFEEFIAESRSHGWPSFRDEEVDWENVRCLANGECVSLDGTHLGHNIPDRRGNRYCINLVCIAGRPTDGSLEG